MSCPSNIKLRNSLDISNTQMNCSLLIKSQYEQLTGQIWHTDELLIKSLPKWVAHQIIAEVSCSSNHCRSELLIKHQYEQLTGHIYRTDESLTKSQNMSHSPRVEWKGLKIGGGNLIHRKCVCCIFRCQSIWVGISAIIRVLWVAHIDH